MYKSKKYRYLSKVKIENIINKVLFMVWIFKKGLGRRDGGGGGGIRGPKGGFLSLCNPDIILKYNFSLPQLYRNGVGRSASP